MLRTIALLAALAVTVAAFAACGGGDDSSSTTATTNESASASAGASASPGSTATGTAAGSATPVAATAAPTAVLGDWDVSGQIQGTANIGANSCQTAGEAHNMQLAGSLNSTPIGILLTITGNGTIDFSQASTDATVAIYYGATGTSTNDYWFGIAGASGLSGTATISSDGSGSLQLTVPPSAVAPAGATDPITVSGPWTCPS